MKNRRKLAETLLSSISPKARLYATCAAAVMILCYGVIMAAILGYIEEAAGTLTVQDSISRAIVSMLHSSKFLVPLFFVGVALYVLLAELGRTRKINSEMVAIVAQIRFFRRGLYGKKRSMRKHDELQPIMAELHKLADELQLLRERRSESAEPPRVVEMGG